MLLSLVFAIFSLGPVYDGKIHFGDIQHYIESGISLKSIQAQTNPQAPGVYLFFASISKVLGSHYKGFRLIILFLWGLIFWFLYSGKIVKESSLSSLLALGLVVHPYFALTSGSIMTEVFALLCSLAAWILYCSNRKVSWIYCGFFLGLSFLFRQYYMAVIGAFLLTAFFENPKSLKWFLMSFFPFVFIVGLFLIWGGLVPPVVKATGIPLSGMSTSVGLNFIRPLSAMMFLGLALFPFVDFGIIFKTFSDYKSKVISSFAIAFGLSLICLTYKESVLAPGPLYSTLKIFTRFPFVHSGLFFLLCWLFQGVFLFVFLCDFEDLLKKRAKSLQKISFFILLLYLLEQVGVKGSLPHFERYTLQVQIFSVYLVALRFPRLDIFRVALMVVSFSFGQYILWKQFLSY